MRRADRNVLIIKLVFVAVFAGACALIWWYQLSIARPRARCLARPGAVWFAKSKVCQVPPSALCEATGNWWDPVTKTCARVVHIPDFTGKPMAAPKP